MKLYSLQANLFEDLRQDAFPSLLRTWHGQALSLTEPGTHFGFVYAGNPQLEGLQRPDSETALPNYPLQAGMYFCLPGSGRIGGAGSTGIVFTRLGYDGMFSLGGPLEATGRFAYINGGTSSLLVPPIMVGDPCLNAMYFPPGVEQTLHTHPSYRIGLIVSGRGKAATPETVVALEPGMIFWIPPNQLHRFQTTEDPLVIVVFHPDSEAGFSHRDNPMLKRTFVEGISAADLPQIQTPMALNTGIERSI